MDWRRGQFYSVLQQLQTQGVIRLSVDSLAEGREWSYKETKDDTEVFTRNIFWGVSPQWIPGPVVQMAALYMPAVRELLAKQEPDIVSSVPITEEFAKLVQKAPPVNHITFQPFTKKEWIETLQTRANINGQPDQPIKVPNNVDWPELHEKGALIKGGQLQLPAGSYAMADQTFFAHQKASQS